MLSIEAILAAGVQEQASDIHINAGLPPIIRRNTELIQLDFPPLGNGQVREMLIGMVGQERFQQFQSNQDPH